MVWYDVDLTRFSASGVAMVRKECVFDVEVVLVAVIVFFLLKIAVAHPPSRFMCCW